MKFIKKRSESIQNWIKSNRKEAVVLVSILLFGAVLRLYKIDQYLTFLGDEGRDVIIVRRLLVAFDPILIGPGTSIGNMYLGPLYYYMMAPALLFANFSPVGPAVMVALFGLLTVFFVWYIAREWFGATAAWISALLYSVAPTIIIYSRSSWNPNIMPFFALVAIYSTWQIWTKGKFRWLLILGVSFAAAMQSHYLGLILFPIVGIFWLLTLIRILKSKKAIRNSFLKNSFGGGAFFALMMSPLLLFDIRHEFINFNAMKLFFTQRQTTVNAKPWKALPNIFPIFEEVITRLVAGYSESFGRGLVVILTLGSIAGILQGIKRFPLKKLLLNVYKKRDQRVITARAFILLSVWISISIIGLGLYKQQIYDHYYGFFYVAPFILLGGIIQLIKDWSKVAFGVALVGVLALLITNLQSNPLQYSPNRQLERSSEVADKILLEANGDSFNFAVIAERNYEGAYQYEFERRGSDFIVIDVQRVDETVTDQLFVICEMEKVKCDPTRNAKAEITGFGWSIIEDEWDVFGTTLYKLGHSPDIPQ